MKSLELFLQSFEVFVGKLLEVDHRCAGASYAFDKFIQLQVNRFCVAVLRVLNQKDHQKGDDRRAGVDDQLPGVRIVKHWTGDRPRHDDSYGENEGP